MRLARHFTSACHSIDSTTTAGQSLWNSYLGQLPLLFSNVPLFTTTIWSSSAVLPLKSPTLNPLKIITRVESAISPTFSPNSDSICYYFICLATTFPATSTTLLQPSPPTFDSSYSCILRVNRSPVNLLRGQQVLQEPPNQPKQYLRLSLARCILHQAFQIVNCLPKTLFYLLS